MSSMGREEKIGRILGELESEIMELVWNSSNSVSVRVVADNIQKKRKVAYTTVMTIMGRLVKKGLLKRKSTGVAYVYTSVYSKDQFLSRVSQQIIKNMVANFGDLAIANFSKEIEKIPLEKRRKLISALKKANGNL